MSGYQQAATIIRQHIGDRQPRLALVLGSGLGAVAEQLEDAVSVPFSTLPGWPQATVAGHAGRILAGRWQGVELVCLQGRLHYYEGHPPAALALPVRTLQALGCRDLLLTNAAGSLRPEMGPGSLMLINDHINWAGVNPLIGPNEDTLGPRFFDLSQAWDKDLQQQLRQAAASAMVSLHEGVYLMCTGPNFETPAEIRAFARLGADAVGMSTVPECLVARHCGMRVAGVSSITNLAAGLSDGALSHEETLRIGQQAGVQLQTLLAAFMQCYTGS